MQKKQKPEQLMIVANPVPAVLFTDCFYNTIPAIQPAIKSGILKCTKVGMVES